MMKKLENEHLDFKLLVILLYSASASIVMFIIVKI